jgi:hypothetical protein
MKIRPVLYKLQKQALDDAANELADSGIGEIVRYCDLFTEKFADLVLKECLGLLETCVKVDPYNGETCALFDNDEVNSIIFESINIIKEHFGIEE